MRINEWKKDVTEIKDIKEYSGKTAKTAKTGQTEECFDESLKRSISYGMTEEKMPEETTTAEMTVGKQVVLPNSLAQKVSISVRKLGEHPIPKEVPARQIPYEECDKVKIDVLEGYTLKAKLEKESDNGNAEIYAEVKCDDGETKAYLFDAEGFLREEALAQNEEGKADLDIGKIDNMMKKYCISCNSLF